MQKVNWLKTDHNITVNYNGETHILSLTDSLAPQLIDALKNRNYDEIPNLVNKARLIKARSNGHFTVDDGNIFIDGVMVPIVLGNKILQFSEEGLPYEPLLAFAKNLQNNTSYRAINQLYGFLEKYDHPITENGCFIAYKKVKYDFKDTYTGTFDNSPGNVIEMPRNQVDEDVNAPCRPGLHVSSYAYARDFYGGGLMLEVEVNPADVVAIPVDYQHRKIRCSKYKVIGTVECEITSSFRNTTPLQEDDGIDIEWDDNSESYYYYDD